MVALQVANCLLVALLLLVADGFVSLCMGDGHAQQRMITTPV
jgi:hypothetical protein